jgi:alcohol dehydrogenase class IV
VARLITGDPHAAAEDGVRWIAELCRQLEIPPLRTYGLGEVDVVDLAVQAARASSMKGNPIALTGEELREIIARAI